MSVYDAKKTPSFPTTLKGNSAEGNELGEGLVKNGRSAVPQREHAAEEPGLDKAPAVFQK